MNTLTSDEIQAKGIGLSFSEDELTCVLSDGRTITVPLAWYPRLLNATEAQRNDFEWLGEGYGIHWPQVDEDLTVGGFLRGAMAPGGSRKRK
jgi:hypothetical protein